MAKIVKRKIKWNPVGEDVVSYKVYWVVGGGVIDYASADFVEVDAAITQVIVPDDVPALASVEDDVTIGVSAVDDVGNESDVAAVTVPFDFTAPSAPTGLVVETL